MDYFAAHPVITLSAAFGGALAVLAFSVWILYRRWGAVFGKRARSNRDALATALERLAKVEERIEANEPRIAVLEAIGQIAVQHVGFARFNPFADTGSDQSFAVALLDRNHDGIVLSSLYTRDGVRVYAKEIRDGVPHHPLSEEERRVLERAINTEVPKS